MVRLTFDPDGDVLFTLSISKPASEESDNKSSDKDLADGSQSERPTKRQKTLPQNEEANEQQDLNIENDLEAEECVTEFLVSSSHLKLASKMFRSMLQPHFVEGQALRDSGNVTILLFDDDTAALNVVMKIVHAQSKDLPTEMDSKLLAQVATIVDKYQLQDCVGYFAQEWIKRLTLVQKISSNKAELQSYLCIAWVFKAQSLFAQTTLHAIKHAKKHTLRELSMATVPIPKAVIERLEKERIRCIQKVLKVMEKTIQKYQANSQVHCPNSAQLFTMHVAKEPDPCDSLKLGFLIKGTMMAGLFPVPSHEDYTDSYTGLTYKIQSIAKSIPSYCESNRNKRGYEDTCRSLNKCMASDIDKITASLQGLDLHLQFSNPSIIDLDSDKTSS